MDMISDFLCVDCTVVYHRWLDMILYIKRNRGTLLCGIVSFLVFFILIILLACLYRVEQHQIAFTENMLNAKIHGPFDQGTHMARAADRIYKFERTFQQNLLIIPCMTFDKLLFNAFISYQFVYIPDLIVPVVFRLFKNEVNYFTFMERNITQNIITVCSRWNATDYYDRRGEIEQDMNRVVTNGIVIGVEVKALQLKNIAFPPRFNDIITTRQLIEQDRTTAMNARISSIIKANTTRLKAIQEAEIILVKSNQSAQIIQKQGKATSQLILNRWEQVVDSLLKYKLENNVTNTQAIHFLVFETFSKTKNSIVSLQQYLE